MEESFAEDTKAEWSLQSLVVSLPESSDHFIRGDVQACCGGKTASEPSLYHPLRRLGLRNLPRHLTVGYFRDFKRKEELGSGVAVLSVRPGSPAKPLHSI